MDDDEAAFEARFREWQAAVYRWVRRIVRDPGAAEDVTADAFWRAWRARARFDSSKSYGPWIRRIATNAALSHLASARRSGSHDQLRGDLPAPVQAVGDPDVGRTVVAAVRRLSPKLQAVVLLALVEDQPYAEIAGALDVTVATVKVRMFRAVRQLRRDLAHLEPRP